MLLARLSTSRQEWSLINLYIASIKKQSAKAALTGVMTARSGLLREMAFIKIPKTK